MAPKPAHNVTGIDSNDCIEIDYSKCFGCNACARTCTGGQTVGALFVSAPKQPPFVHNANGDDSANTETTRVKLALTNCIGCGQCVKSCNLGALHIKDMTTEIEKAKAAGKTLVAVLAPATRVGISEAMGMQPGTTGEAQLIAGLRQLGFKYVFDNLWGADACTIEDTKEVIHMKEHKCGPCYTSCCPAWINFVETQHPEKIPQISTARSPNGMICSTIKKHWCKDVNIDPHDLFVVGCMPCTAKKSEAARKELMTEDMHDCDISITTMEVAAMFKKAGITFSPEKEAELHAKPEGRCDEPFSEVSGSAYIFGKTAGVTESVVRYIYQLAKEDIKPDSIKSEVVWTHTDKLQTITILEFTAGGVTYRAAVAHGGAAVSEVIKREKELNVDVVEVMMCPLGCQNGGGQPKQRVTDLIKKRAAALDMHDHECKYADCDHNQKMHEYINRHMPTEEDIHKCFHTQYTNRKAN